MSMETVITTAQIICVMVLAIGTPVYAYLQLKWRVEAAEKRARSERLGRLASEAKLEQTVTALSKTEQRMVRGLRDGVGPHDNPPLGIVPMLRWAAEHGPPDPYFVAFGWECVRGTPALAGISLHGDSPVKATHGLITGETDSGKGVLAFLLFYQLAATSTPDQLRVVWVDPKRDGSLLCGCAHLWTAPCLEANDISDALALLRLERERRSKLREQQKVLRWEELDSVTRPPLLFVYVGELDLVAQALATARGISVDKAEDEVDAFLTTELVSARADGIRYLIDVQDAANRRMRWRKQISYFCAGYTSTLRGIEPSLNATPDEVRLSGALLPTSFKAPGYFTVRVRSDFATIRTPLITLDERKRVIASLPHVTHHLTAADRLAKLREALDMLSEVTAFARSNATDADLGAALQALPLPVEAGDMAAQVKHPTLQRSR
jgi:DNA translocase FtsK/SpoIIIE-like protein